jgi:hypothetical protein
MFDLETEIAGWRKQMLATGIQTPVPLEELEIHLREEFQAQIRAGAAPRRAFENAASRLGSPAAIKQEFGKVGEDFPACARIFNYTVSTVVLCCAVALDILSYIVCLDGEHAPLGERVSMAGALLASALPLSAWMFLWRFLPVLPAKHLVIGVPVCLVLAAFCTNVLMRFLLLGSGTKAELAIAIAWALVPLCAVMSLIFGLEEAVYRARRRAS